jgi:hypothetical protein
MTIMFKPLSMSHEWSWFKERTHVIACEDSQGIVAIDETGRIHAIAAFDSFTVDACNVHMAIDNPFVLRHGFLNEIGRHLFHACGRKRIFGLVPANNKKALKLDKHIGMHEVARVPDAVAEGIDYIVMRMDKADCRWIEQLEEVA